jgi:hypothetical protein
MKKYNKKIGFNSKKYIEISELKEEIIILKAEINTYLNIIQTSGNNKK